MRGPHNGILMQFEAALEIEYPKDAPKGVNYFILMVNGETVCREKAEWFDTLYEAEHWAKKKIAGLFSREGIEE